MKRLFVVVMIIVVLLVTSGCGPPTHTTVADIMAKGQSGDWVRFYSARVIDINYSPIMQQTGFYLGTDGTGDYVTAIAANAVVQSGLERIQAEESGLTVKIYGKMTDHDVLGTLIFIHELEVIDNPGW
ncbi:MAG: hypothetical protein APF76_11205 [Desulfitibacter sp. BRH_c19]|nr:MAG: hypothetical protein APF76_11205 [Desulfitibacter sp. BRH_c19]